MLPIICDNIVVEETRNTKNPKMNNNILNKLSYKYRETIKLTKKELKDCSELYSNNYGTYTKKSKINPGGNVKFSEEMYRKHYQKPNFYVAMAYDNNKLVAQSFYIRKRLSKRKVIYFIFQLVVDKDYRGNGIATKLMRSIWGFTDCYAWGLITPNIRTVETLESTTFRKCNPKIIKKHIKDIKEIANDLFFIKEKEFCITEKESLINTDFHVERKLNINDNYKGIWELGDLPDGYEWIAFTFREQDIDIKKYKERFPEIIKYSEDILKDAYGRMNKKSQCWAKGHKEECKYILNKVNSNNSLKILDIGCGTGRHSIEFAKHGYKVVAIDFSKNNIIYARKKRKLERKYSLIKNLNFYISDIRRYKTENKFNLITCLYDVVGSFPENKDNLAIISKAYDLLEENGFFVISVMNFELTDAIVPDNQKADLSENPQILLKLQPSKEMMKTGNIFVPIHLAIDTKDNLVYRKEQFTSYRNYYLPAEYIIRDKRYKKDEIINMVESVGFKVLESKYVKAGHFDIELDAIDNSAKEILLICQK